MQHATKTGLIVAENMHMLCSIAFQVLLALITLAVIRGLVFLAKCYAARRAYAKDKVPGPPPAKSILGHVHYYAANKGPIELAKLANEYGPLFKLQILKKVRYTLTDPAEILRVSRRTGPGPYLPKPRELYMPLEIFTNPHLPNILTANDGPYWKAVRQGTAPCFSATNMKKVLPLVLNLTKRCADKMSQAVIDAGNVATIFDVSDAATRITSDVMGYLLFGEDLEGTKWKESEYLTVFKQVLMSVDELFTNPLYFWQRFWNRDIAEQYRAMKKHDRIMAQKMQRLQQNPPPEYTIAAHLLAVLDPATGKPLTLNQLKAEASIFMGAGFETTSHAITWNLAMLAAHQDVQQKAVDELKAAGLAPSGALGVRDIAASDLGNLPYLSAVMKEALRLLPPNPWGGNKVTTEETVICGHKLPKGAFIETTLLPYALAKYNYGEDAALFKPERWISDTAPASPNSIEDLPTLPDNATIVTGSSASEAVLANGRSNISTNSPPDPLTFMVGPRDCLGQSLAKLELQVVLAVLLSKFRFYPGEKLQRELEVAEATGQPPVMALYNMAIVYVTMQPAGGEMKLLIKPRM